MSCVDLALSLKLSNGNVKLAADLLALLLEDLESNHSSIRRALSEERYENALDLIHKLHGASCYCGTPKLQEACKHLEKQLHANLAQPVQKDIDCFSAAVDALLHWQKIHDVPSFFQ